jgi:serine/threonine-protein kinase
MEFPQPFGKYTLVRPLASGGMAELFLAHQAGAGGFEKEVVVKRLLSSHAENVDFVKMFLDEARIAARLTHPNIAQIFELGEYDGQHYIAMEYVPGVDLRRLCSQGIAAGDFLPLQHALRVIAEVCDALAYAHGRTDSNGAPLSIVHRDISPTNVLVTLEGGVKLVDFGIAKASNNLAVTRTGQIKGKFGYMSPEQVAGGVVDARSDVFAVGINLYELTLGRRLFRGESEVETLNDIENARVPRPTSISPDYPVALERVVMKALARSPDDRYPSARALQAALEEVIAQLGPRSTRATLALYVQSLFPTGVLPDLRPAPRAATGAGVGVSLTPNLTMEPSIDELIAVEASGIAPGPAPMRPRPPALPSDFTPFSLMPSDVQATRGLPAQSSSILMRPAPPDAPLPIRDVDEAEIAVRRPSRYRSLALLGLLAVAAVFGLRALFSDEASDPQARLDSPVSLARSLPTAPPTAPLAVITAPPTEAPRLAILRLETTPPGARIVVNGNILNATTPASLQTLAGAPSTVRFLMAGFRPFETRVTPTTDGTDVRVSLERGKPETAGLRIESSPPGATLLMNGVPVGATPVHLEKVAAGVGLTLRLEKPGFTPHVVLFSLIAGESREIALTLEAESGPRSTSVLSIESIPLGADVRDVLVDGGKASLGKTGADPVKYARPLDGHTRLRASLPGYPDVEADVDLKQPYYTLYLRFPPKKAAFGQLSLGGVAGLTVYVGPEEVGVTPLKALKVEAGEHDVVLVEQATGARVEAKVRIDADKVVTRTVVREGPATLRLQ